MSRKIDILEAANWTEDEAEVNLAYIRDNLGDMNLLVRALDARGISWEEFNGSPEPTLFPQPDGGDRGRQQSVGAQVAVEPAEVPTGTVDEVLDWVNDNPSRAADALEAEREGKNRSSLIDALESVIEDEG